MVTVKQIKEEITGYRVLKDVIEIEFEDYILEMDLKDIKGVEVNKSNLAEIIFKQRTSSYKS